MTDDPDRPASPVAEPTRQMRRVVSAVWLVPIMAVLVALAIAWQSWQSRGVLIAVTFPDASGVEAGTTTLRYREVTVGVVEDIGFTADLQFVNVYIRVNNAIAPYLDEDASFWIVQPEVTARGVEGLNTILSGTYIEGTWDNTIDEPRVAFLGDERAPIVPPGVEGTPIVLRARDSARLGPGAPILYRGIEVGEVADPRLSPDGTEVRVDAFIRAPYDRRLSTATRFWDSSGISATLGAGGVDLRIGSIASILEGGVTFDTLISGGEPIRAGQIFSIFEDEAAALASTYETPSGRSIRLSALFPSAASGLSEGSPVLYQGVRVGVVTDLTGFIRPDDPTEQVQLLTVLSVQPARMGLDNMVNDLDGIDFVDDLVDEGLRARLTSLSLFGSDLGVELATIPDAPPGDLEIGVAENPLLPSAESEISGLTASAEGVLDRINDLPIEELLASATNLLDNINRIAADDATRALPAETLALLEDSRDLVRDGRNIISSPEVASVLLAMSETAQDLRAITADIEERQVATLLADTLEATGAAAANVAEGTEDFAALTAQAQDTLAGASALLNDEDTQALPGVTREALTGARDLLDAPELDTILADTAAAVADIRSLVAPFDGSALAATITSALDRLDRVAADVAAGTADLDTLRGTIDSIAASAEALVASADTQALPGAARGLLDDGRALVNSPEIETILIELASVTADIGAITRELAEREAVQRLTDALDAAAQAADSVAEGVQNLPEITASAERVLASAETLGAGLNDLTDKANALALDELVNSTTQLMQTADAFLSSDEADDVPVVLADTLEELRLTIETIRTGGTLDNLNVTLRSAAGAAESIQAGAADLPALLARLQAVTRDASAVLQTYGDGSRVNTELYTALRAVARAAEDVSSLSRTIERNPNSLLLGR